jgi:hypothetical protein
MKVSISVESADPIDASTTEAVNNEIRKQGQASEARISVRSSRALPGSFSSIDPSIMQILVDVVKSSAWGPALTSVTGVLLLMLKRKPVDILVRVDKTELRLPANASAEEIVSAAERLIAAQKVNRAPRE